MCKLWDLGQGSLFCFFFWRMDFQLFWYHLLKRLLFLHQIAFTSLLKICCCSVVSHVRIFAIPWLQHTRLPCPSPSPGVCANSCPLSWWCHPTTSSSVTRFSPPALNLFQHQDLQKLDRHICIDLFLCSLFYSIDICVYSSSSTILCWYCTYVETLNRRMILPIVLSLTKLS